MWPRGKHRRKWKSLEKKLEPIQCVRKAFFYKKKKQTFVAFINRLDDVLAFFNARIAGLLRERGKTAIMWEEAFQVKQFLDFFFSIHNLPSFLLIIGKFFRFLGLCFPIKTLLNGNCLDKCNANFRCENIDH